MIPFIPLVSFKPLITKLGRNFQLIFPFFFLTFLIKARIDYSPQLATIPLTSLHMKLVWTRPICSFIIYK